MGFHVVQNCINPGDKAASGALRSHPVQNGQRFFRQHYIDTFAHGSRIAFTSLVYTPFVWISTAAVYRVADPRRRTINRLKYSYIRAGYNYRVFNFLF